MDSNQRLMENGLIVGDWMERIGIKHLLQRLVGRLIYLSHTWPYIAYAVSVVSQFMHDPRASHLEVVYCILRYKLALGKELLFSNNGYLKLKAFSNADCAGSVDVRRSTSGIVPWLEVIWLHGKVRSKQWLSSLVQRLNTELWPMGFVSFCGSEHY